jgi:energy-coupling factor transporter ATP-binding protein EcfA2
MKIYQVEIDRFRGINKLDWTVGGNFVCLVGAGDSTKSTILDAIELALSPRWNIVFDDSDFYNGASEKGLKIRVTVGEIDDKLLKESKYGLHTRGWKDGKLSDEPQDDDELVLTVQLSVDQSLEPVWTIVNDRLAEDKRISSYDRQAFSVARLGGFVDKHLSWTKGSVLSHLTGDIDGLSGLLAEANREARKSFKPHEVSKLQTAAKQVQELAKGIGVASKDEYCPGLDVQATTVNVGGVTLHDGKVPLRRAGMGTRRLLISAIQKELAKQGAIALVDEVEHGLEPHRILHFLKALQLGKKDNGQVLMITHSPVVVTELEAENLRIVRSTKDGVVDVKQIDAGIQDIVRRSSYAFLARKLIICEGRTEVGFCNSLDNWWHSQKRESFGYLGLVPVNGNGHEAPKVAVSLSDLDYDIALLVDSDKPLNPDENKLKEEGIAVISWSGDVCIEERLALDLPWSAIIEILKNVAERSSCERCVCDAVRNRLGSRLPDNIDSWEDSNGLRQAIGKYIKEDNKGDDPKGKGLFKSIDGGEFLGNILVKHIENIPEKDIAKKVCELRAWIDKD